MNMHTWQDKVIYARQQVQHILNYRVLESQYKIRTKTP